MRLKIAALWVVCQLLFFAGWALWEESYLADGEGRSILVKVVPVDPRDLLSGQYFRLAYDFSRPTQALTSMPPGSEVWAVLKKEGDFYLLDSLRAQQPGSLAPEAVALKGRLTSRWRIEYGVERYFVPEDTPDPDRKDLSVRLRISPGGKARIEQVYLKGLPWP